MIRKTLLAAAILVVAFAAAPAPTRLDVTVSEGTSMSVAVSPDGRTLADQRVTDATAGHVDVMIGHRSRAERTHHIGQHVVPTQPRDLLDKVGIT